MLFHVLYPGDPRISDARRTISQCLATQYVGWDDAVDRRYDAHAIWFCLRDPQHPQYVATCKLVFKYRNGTTYQLPVEAGDQETCVIRDTNPMTCEASGVSYVHKLHLIHLMYALGHWMQHHATVPCYAICDVTNAVLHRFYTRVLGFHVVPDAYVQYSGFTRKVTHEPVRWQVMVLRASDGNAGLQRLERLGAVMPDYHN